MTQRDWREVRELLRAYEIERPKLDARGHTTILKAMRQSRQAPEKAVGQLEFIRKDGAGPNVFHYSAAISACEKGGQWERALGLLEGMRVAGLEPNVITYNAAIQACAAGDQWEHARRLFAEVDASASLQADIVTFNAVLDAVCTADPSSARGYYRRALAQGLYAPIGEAHRFQIDLHDHSEGAAETAVRWWLEDEVPERLQAAGDDAPEQLIIVTGWGKTREVHATSDVRGRVEATLRDMGVLPTESHNPGRVLVDVAAWTASAA